MQVGSPPPDAPQVQPDRSLEPDNKRARRVGETVVLRGRYLRLWRLTVLGIVVVPFIGLIAAAVWWKDRGLDLVQHGLFLLFYLLTAFGVTAGYHRLLTHRSFETSRWLRSSLTILGSMAVQGPPLRWVAEHRRHHQHSDEAGDPHSPHLDGTGLRRLWKGLFYAHVGWFFDAERTAARRYARDLFRDPDIRRIDRLYPFWVVASLLVPSVIAFAIEGTTTALIAGILWPGLARIFAIQHVTWSVNSVCHMFGTRDFSSGDESRNNWIFGVLSLGEGWHNGHHAFPSSARHGLLWYQFDATYVGIRLLQAVGAVRQVKVPDGRRLQEKRLSRDRQVLQEEEVEG